MVSHTTRLVCYAIPLCPGPSHPDTKVYGILAMTIYLYRGAGRFVRPIVKCVHTIYTNCASTDDQHYNLLVTTFDEQLPVNCESVARSTRLERSTTCWTTTLSPSPRRLLRGRRATFALAKQRQLESLVAERTRARGQQSPRPTRRTSRGAQGPGRTRTHGEQQARLTRSCAFPYPRSTRNRVPQDPCPTRAHGSKAKVL